jgi:hypothetical protein
MYGHGTHSLCFVSLLWRKWQLLQNTSDMIFFIKFGKLTSNIVTMIFSMNFVIFSTRICILFCRNYDDGALLHFVLLASFCGASSKIFFLFVFFYFSFVFNGNCDLLHCNHYWVCVGGAIIISALALRWFNWIGWEVAIASASQNLVGRRYLSPRRWWMGCYWPRWQIGWLWRREFMCQSQLLHGRINNLWCRTTTNNQSTMSHLVDAIPIVIVMPFAVEPKPNDVLLNLPHLAFNTIKPLIMSTDNCPMGLHSKFFVVGVVACVSVVCQQTKIVKPLIPIDVARSDRRDW